MAQIYEERKVERIEQTLKRATCDWCGVDITELIKKWWRDADRREFELHVGTGYSSREGGSLGGWQVEDLCDDCVAKLKQLLSDAGIKISKYRVDW